MVLSKNVEDGSIQQKMLPAAELTAIIAEVQAEQQPEGDM